MPNIWLGLDRAESQCWEVQGVTPAAVPGCWAGWSAGVWGWLSWSWLDNRHVQHLLRSSRDDNEVTEDITDKKCLDEEGNSVEGVGACYVSKMKIQFCVKPNPTQPQHNINLNCSCVWPKLSTTRLNNLRPISSFLKVFLEHESSLK